MLTFAEILAAFAGNAIYNSQLHLAAAHIYRNGSLIGFANSLSTSFTVTGLNSATSYSLLPP
jgi:hypothetical protein